MQNVLPFMRLYSLLVGCIAFLTASSLSQAQAKADIRPPDDVLLDYSWDIYLGQQPIEKRFAVIQRAFERDPQNLAIKSHYAEFLIGGKAFGAPEDRIPEGLRLSKEAMGAGSVTSIRALATANAFARGVPCDMREAIYLFTKAAQAGNVRAMILLGKFQLNEEDLGAYVSDSESWFRLAAQRGQPEMLYKLGLIYEKNREGKTLSIARAATLIYEAAIYGSNEALTRMKEVSKQKDAAPEMRRAACLTLMWAGALGSDGLQSSRVKAAATELESHYPNDPEVLLALGTLYRSGEFGFRDPKKTARLYEKAAQLGSDDARSEYASLQAEGLGCTADPVAALATWRELEKKNHAKALSALGYYSYWGSLKDSGLPKDARLAFEYSARAANAGDFFGQANVTQCYAHGIGTEKNYAAASVYSHAAALRGLRLAQKELPKYLTAAFE